MSVMIVTSLGDLVIDLFTDRCPLTCKNFLKLCKIKYYNGCLFHTVQKDFSAQTGDPTGTGSGGDSVYKFLYGEQARFFGDEIHLDLKHSKKGMVAMASAGENLNASQFYITLRDDLDYLDGKHTVFGELAEGVDTLDRINEAFVDEKGRPFKNIRIKHTYILDDPFDDPPQLDELIPEASPEGKPKDEVDDDVRLEDDWVPLDEQIGTQELEEVLRAKEAHSRAVVLESIGDIPDAEIRPPDNVLFVCKLNPVTEDEDLYTLFSRFGTVTSAEIIRDYKTGDSLGYAFIEFEDKEACEQAYFKMDNVLIDDRRIHVDFSQSVSKLWSSYRRKDQMSKGSVCFKCGSVDHIAKDCSAKQNNQKYMLKEANRQHGGGDNSRFEMVFDEDATGSQRGDKRHRDCEAEEGDQKQRAKHRGSDDDLVRDEGKRIRHDHIGLGHTSKDIKEDRHGGSTAKSSSSRGERERRNRMGSPLCDEEERSHTGRHRASPSSRGVRDSDHREINDSDHRMKGDRSHKERREEAENGRRDRRREKEYNRRDDDIRRDKQETENRGRKEEAQYDDGRYANGGGRYRGDKGNTKDYEERHGDYLARKRRASEQDHHHHGKRSSKADDACDGSRRR